MKSSTTYTLNELCEAADVSERTVRYYVTQGLLPSPGTGRGVRWSQEHLERLQLIRELKDKHLPLAEIRRRLEGMAPAEVSALLASQQAQAPASSAADYVSQVLAGIRPAPARKSKKRAAPSKAAPSTPAPPVKPPPPGAPPPGAPSPRAGAVPVHVRRPLSRAQDKRVQRLLTAARGIFDQEES